MLGHRVGVDALAAGPRPAVAEHARGGHGLHPGPRQLHPADLRGPGEDGLQGLDLEGVEPDEGLRLLGRDDGAAALLDRGGRPRSDGLGADGDEGAAHGVGMLRAPCYPLPLVANIKSQIKRNKQNEKRRLRNKAARSEIKTRVKAAVTSAEAGAETSADALRLAVKRLDMAAAKGIIHKNQASNRKSRLMKRIAKLTASSS